MKISCPTLSTGKFLEKFNTAVCNTLQWSGYFKILGVKKSPLGVSISNEMNTKKT